MKSTKKSFFACVVMSLAAPSWAEDFLIESSNTDSYHYVDHYEITIEALPEDVWPALVDFGSWMNELALDHESGPVRSEGETFTLYGDQNYRIQIAKLIPSRMAAVVNLPSSVDGEDSVGISMFALSESDGMTLLSLSMSRRYDWSGGGVDPGRARRTSQEFKDFNETLWGTMLSRLKNSVEEP